MSDDDHPPHDPALGGRHRRFTGREARLGSDRSLPSLLAALHGDSRRDRFAAARALSQMGAAAVPGLAAALYAEDARVRGAAAQTLGRIGSEAVPALLDTLDNGPPYTRAAAMQSLGLIGGQQVVDALSVALYDEHDAVQRGAAFALGQIGADAVPVLIVALMSRDHRVRWGAARALERARDPVAIPHLAHALQDPAATVRAAALRTLESFHRLDTDQIIAHWRQSGGTVSGEQTHYRDQDQPHDD